MHAGYGIKTQNGVLEPVIIDPVFSLQSFSKFMRINDVLYLFIYLFNNSYFHTGFYMGMYKKA